MLNIKVHRSTSDMLQRPSNIRLSPPSRFKKWAEQAKAAAGPDGDPFSWSREAWKEEKEIYKQARKSGLAGDSEGGKFSEFMNSGAGKAIASGIGSITTPLTGNNNTVSETSLNIRNSISDAAISSGNPIAMAVGAAAKVVDAIGDVTGFHIDDIDKDAGDRAGVDGGARFLNNAMNAIPGNSLVMAAFAPGKTHKSNSLDESGQEVINAYSGSEKDINAANKLSGKRTLFGIGRRKMNRFIDATNKDVDLINEIGYTNSLAKKSDYSRDIAQQNLNRYAGTNYQVHAVGKRGMKILSRKELQDILAKRKYQKGGVIGTDSSVLPEGSLHARLNHLQDVNPELEDTTRKGIPVLDANGEQVAEIERDELVLTKALTDKIEELMKDGSEEAMIEAGKLIAAEIIENTQDNTGQITEEV